MEKKEARAIKIVDTVGNFGAAENHILINTDFERFIKKTYGKHDILKTDPAAIIKKYKLKGFVFGNYVTQEERYHFLFKISKQLEAIAKLTGKNNLGKGVLIIAFGSEGHPKANAHYNPEKQLINLNRGRKGDYTDVLKGENSFIHEYGHFIDFLAGRKDKTIGVNFSSEVEDELGLTGNAQTKLISGLVDSVQRKEAYMANLWNYPNGKYLASRIELWARLFETALSYYITDNYKQYKAFVDVKKYGKDIYLKKSDIKPAYYKYLIKVLKAS